MRYHQLSTVHCIDPASDYDLLWQLASSFTDERPGWYGMMQKLFFGDNPGQASISYRPLIPLSASNENCILSALTYAANVSKKYGFSPVITFDQPLHWKANIILQQQPTSSDLHLSQNAHRDKGDLF